MHMLHAAVAFNRSANARTLLVLRAGQQWARHRRPHDHPRCDCELLTPPALLLPPHAAALSRRGSVSATGPKVNIIYIACNIYQ